MRSFTLLKEFLGSYNKARSFDGEKGDTLDLYTELMNLYH